MFPISKGKNKLKKKKVETLNYLESNRLSYTLYLEIPFSKILCHIETSQLICEAYQLNSFCIIQVFTKMNFQIEFSK